MSDTTSTTGSTQGGDFSEAVAALDRIDSELGAAGLEGRTRAQLCERYKAIRPLILSALKLIEAIPVWGPKIGKVVRFLMSIADHCCDVTV